VKALRRALLRWVSIYPPYLGAGIRARAVSHRPLVYEVWMKLHWWNRNYVGTHFGGSLFSMSDPFFMLILIDALGPGYAVWNKTSTIRFLRPGRGRVHARFEIPVDRIAEIRAQVDAEGRAEPRFEVEIHDPADAVVARVEQFLSVRMRPLAAARRTEPRALADR